MTCTQEWHAFPAHVLERCCSLSPLRPLEEGAGRSNGFCRVAAPSPFLVTHSESSLLIVEYSCTVASVMTFREFCLLTVTAMISMQRETFTRSAAGEHLLNCINSSKNVYKGTSLTAAQTSHPHHLWASARPLTLSTHPTPLGSAALSWHISKSHWWLLPHQQRTSTDCAVGSSVAGA